MLLMFLPCMFYFILFYYFFYISIPCIPLYSPFFLTSSFILLTDIQLLVRGMKLYLIHVFFFLSHFIHSPPSRHLYIHLLSSFNSYPTHLTSLAHSPRFPLSFHHKSKETCAYPINVHWKFPPSGNEFWWLIWGS